MDKVAHLVVASAKLGHPLSLHDTGHGWQVHTSIGSFVFKLWADDALGLFRLLLESLERSTRRVRPWNARTALDAKENIVGAGLTNQEADYICYVAANNVASERIRRTLSRPEHTCGGDCRLHPRRGGYWKIIDHRVSLIEARLRARSPRDIWAGPVRGSNTTRNKGGGDRRRFHEEDGSGGSEAGDADDECPTDTASHSEPQQQRDAC